MAINDLQRLTQQYASALQDYCLKPHPDAAAAHDLGQQAVAAGLTMADVIQIYQQAVDAPWSIALDHQNGAALAKVASSFMTQSLLAFERAAQQANDNVETALQRRNAELERRVREQTAALEQKNAALEALVHSFPDSVFNLAADGPDRDCQALAIARYVSEREQVEAALRLQAAEICRSRDLFAGVFEASADALFLVSPVTNCIINCNQRAVELLEVDDRAALIGIVGSTFHKEPFSADDIAAAFAQLETVGGWSQEVEYVTGKGNRFWGYCTAKCIQVNDEPLHLIRVTDITDRKRTEAALHESETRFQQLAANIPGVFYQSVLRPDESRQFTYLSSGYQQLFEVDPAVLLTNADTFWQLVHPDDITSLQEQIKFSLSRLQTLQVECRIVTPSGRMKWIQTVANRRRLLNGDIISDGITLDITDRKQAEAALKISEQNFRTIFNTVNSSIWVHDLDGKGAGC